MSFLSFSSDLSFSPSTVISPSPLTYSRRPSQPQLDLDDPDESLSPVPSAADDHHHTDGCDPKQGPSSGTNRSGRKKSNPSSQAARRDQNRIAQREFRLRKQQRIRDLEARVELLSEGQDEAYAQLRDVIRDLMDENTALRGLLRDVAGFIGEGLGGTLKPRTGWDPVRFREFCERGETDTAYEGWLARKRARVSAAAQASGAPGSEHAEDDEHHDDPLGSRKRRRSTRKDSELNRPFGPSPIGATTGPGDLTSSDKVPSDPLLPRPHLDGLEIDWGNTGLAIPQSNPNARSRRDLERTPSTAAANTGPFSDSFSSNFPGGGTYPGGAPLPGQPQGAPTTRHSPGGGTGMNPSPGGSMSSFPAISPQMSSTRTRLRPSIDTTHGADILPPLASISTLGPPPLDVTPGLSVGIGVGVGVNIGGPGQPSSLFQPPAPGPPYGIAPQLATYGSNVGAGRPISAGGPQPSMYYALHPGGASAATGAEPQTMNPPAPVADDFGETDPQLREAGALIKYHIDNYRRSDNYHLPPSLRPTLTQRTVQHNGVIDGLIFPSMRDRAILLSGRFDLAECFADLMRAVIIHGDDVLAHANWEISLSWMKRYHFLVDEAILNESINPWRRKRGERELTMGDIQPPTSEYAEPNK